MDDAQLTHTLMYDPRRYNDDTIIVAGSKVLEHFSITPTTVRMSEINRDAGDMAVFAREYPWTLTLASTGHAIAVGKSVGGLMLVALRLSEIKGIDWDNPDIQQIHNNKRIYKKVQEAIGSFYQS